MVLASALSLAAAEALPGAEARRAAVLWDGIAAFDSATVSNAMDARVRRPGAVDKVPRPAVFLHPLGRGRALAQYPRFQADLGPHERVFFIGYAGISDGFDWQDTRNPPDGVRFYVVADGRDAAQASVTGPGWQPLAALLYAGGPEGGTYGATLALADDAGPRGNPSYDWALFGEPLVVALDGRPLPAGEAVFGSSGVLVAEGAGGAGRLVVEALDGAGQVVPEAAASAPAPAPGALTFVRFDFGGQTACRQWRWRVEGGAALRAAWGGSWQPSATLEFAGAAASALTATDGLRLRVSVRNAGMGSLLPEHGVSLLCSGQRRPVGPLAPDQTGLFEFDLGPAGQAPEAIEVRIEGGPAPTVLSVPRPVLWAPFPDLDAAPAPRPRGPEIRDLGADYIVVQNAECRWLIARAGAGAVVSVWTGTGFETAGVVSPWAEIVDAAGQTRPILFAGLTATAEQGRVTLRGDAAAGPGLTCTLAGDLKADTPALRLELALAASEPAAVRAFRGPAIRAGERAGGVGKGIAIFPGLEYLEGEERSSSERDLVPPLSWRWAPHKFKITVPLMLVETRPSGPVLGVAWDAAQAWDGARIAPGASFASPDFLTWQDSHLMQLMLPSVPDGIPEHRRQAEAPIPVTPGAPWRLAQFLMAGLPQPDATQALRWFDDLVGYPKPEQAPRSFVEEIELCRHGFLVTTWDAEKQQGRHCVGWASANAPGFATLMLMDARTVAKGQARDQLLDRVNLIAEKTVREQGPGGLASGACCHTLAWEFPYHWGHLPGALEGMRAAALAALEHQEPDGLWGYSPGPDHENLGRPGTRTMGICGRNACLMARYVAITGDPEVRAGLDRALAAMAQFRVPRGAQGWECPILEPDVLASAYAVRAYVWAAMATGDQGWLEQARFWARTGLPFQYAWDDGQHPGMRYASIPVFGSTFFTHSWIGLPVQWCGLVYAYGLQELLRFGPDDLWQRQAEGITVSAMWQQWPLDNRELAGSYPDSFGQWFTVRNGAYINPEGIQLNLLALKGYDPGLRSVPVPLGGSLVHVTAPCTVEAAAAGADGLRIELAYLPGETVYLTVGGAGPGDGFEVRAGGEPLQRQADLPHGSTGWCARESLATLIVGTVCDERGRASLAVSGLKAASPAVARARDAWDFAEGAEDWTGAHSCEVGAAEGALRIRVTGPDPYAVSGAARVGADAHRRLALRVRLRGGGSGVGLFWRGAGSASWGPDKEARLDVPADGQWHEIAFDLSRHPRWAGRILQLRLDVEPADAPAGTTLDVDWIRPQ